MMRQLMNEERKLWRTGAWLKTHSKLCFAIPQPTSGLALPRLLHALGPFHFTHVIICPGTRAHGSHAGPLASRKQTAFARKNLHLLSEPVRAVGKTALSNSISPSAAAKSQRIRSNKPQARIAPFCGNFHTFAIDSFVCAKNKLNGIIYSKVK